MSFPVALPILIGYILIGILYEMSKFTALIRKRAKLAHAIKVWVLENKTRPDLQSIYLEKTFKQEDIERTIQVSRLFAHDEEQLDVELRRLIPSLHMFTTVIVMIFWPLVFLYSDLTHFVLSPFRFVSWALRGAAARYASSVWNLSQK